MDFRSKSQRPRSLIVLWALGAADREEELLSQVELLIGNADIVVIVDDLKFQKISMTGAVVEVLPSTATNNMMPQQDWVVYVKRRVKRIRTRWNPDFEMRFGLSLEDYLDQLGGQMTHEAPKRSIEEVERETPPG